MAAVSGSSLLLGATMAEGDIAVVGCLPPETVCGENAERLQARLEQD